MKAHRLEIFVLDFDELGATGVRDTLEFQKYPNYCISPRVMDIDTVDIGEWDDDHPLNRRETFLAAYKSLFEATDRSEKRSERGDTGTRDE